MQSTKNAEMNVLVFAHKGFTILFSFLVVNKGKRRQSEMIKRLLMGTPPCAAFPGETLCVSKDNQGSARQNRGRRVALGVP